MNENTVPTWIREQEAKNSLHEARNEAEAQRSIAASLRIDKDAPGFFRQLIKELSLNAEALPRIKFRGDVALLPMPSLSGESGCRVSVSMPGNFPKLCYTDVLFFRNTIKCSMLNGGVREYYFCIEGDKFGVLPEIPTGQIHPVNAEEFAEEIVRRMVDHINRTPYF